MDEISHDIGIDLHTESILLRAEQLSRLESEKLVDKVSSKMFFYNPRFIKLNPQNDAILDNLSISFKYLTLFFRFGILKKMASICW